MHQLTRSASDILGYSDRIGQLGIVRGSERCGVGKRFAANRTEGGYERCSVDRSGHNEPVSYCGFPPVFRCAFPAPAHDRMSDQEARSRIHFTLVTGLLVACVPDICVGNDGEGRLSICQTYRRSRTASF